MTKVRIYAREWVPSYRLEPEEGETEGRLIEQDFHNLQISIDGPGGTYSGPQQVSGVPETASDADMLPFIKAAWGGSDDWELDTSTD